MALTSNVFSIRYSSVASHYVIACLETMSVENALAVSAASRRETARRRIKSALNAALQLFPKMQTSALRVNKQTKKGTIIPRWSFCFK